METTVCVRFKDANNLTQIKLIPKQTFAQVFVTFRRDAGRQRPYRKVDNGFMVVGSSGGEYFVEMLSTGPVCQCDDYREQLSVWGRGVCLHGYTGLLASGFETLAEYVETMHKEIAA